MAPRSASTSTDASDAPGDTVLVGTVRGAHGVRGEVRVEAFSDAPERFVPGSALLSGGRTLVVAASRPGTRGLIVRFRGIADRGAAEALRGAELHVPRDEARRAVGDAFLWADLVGLDARTPDGAALGRVSEVLRAGEADVLVIQRDSGELLVPAIASVVRDVDLERGVITVVPQEEHE